MLPQIFLLLLIVSTLCEPERIITTTKYSIFRVSPKIVNGNPVKKGQVPFLVSIKQPVQNISEQKKLWSNLCGGSIIATTKVLTAAHCFELNNFYFASHYKLLRIVAGNMQNTVLHTGRTETSSTGQWRSIVKVILHRNFDFPSNDIALVFVDSPFVFSDTVDQVITASSKVDYPRTCRAAGFGQTTSSPRSDVSKKLLWADIYILSRKQCDLWWEMNMDTFVCTSSMVTDVGGGDSGGPLSCYGTLDRAEQKGKDLLVGIVSGKNYDKTTLFTRVSAYKEWIQKDGCTLRGPSKMLILRLMITFFYIRLLIFVIFECSLYGSR